MKLNPEELTLLGGLLGALYTDPSLRPEEQVSVSDALVIVGKLVRPVA